MSVYVTETERIAPTARWRYKTHAYMYADTTLELDDMAAALGINPRHKQHPLDPEEHYDVTADRASMARRRGAKPGTLRHMGELARDKRKNGVR